MNQLTKMFDGQELRIVEQENEPLFVAKDVCEILDHSDVSVAVSRLDDDEKLTQTLFVSGQNRKTWLINEFGLYNLVLTSRKPEAKQFKRWITHEVIPSIRKHGAYATPETIENIINDPDFGIKLLTNLKDEKDKRVKAEQIIESQKPKVVYAEAVTVSHDTVLVKDLAAVLKQKGIDIGANRLFDWLRDNGYLCKKKGEMWNAPTQRSLDLGIMVTKHGLRTGSDGEMKKTRTPKITGKGQIYFINKFLNQQVVI